MINLTTMATMASEMARIVAVMARTTVATHTQFVHVGAQDVDKFVVNSKIAKALAKRNIFTLLSVGSFVKKTAIGAQIGRP